MTQLLFAATDELAVQLSQNHDMLLLLGALEIFSNGVMAIVFLIFVKIWFARKADLARWNSDNERANEEMRLSGEMRINVLRTLEIVRGYTLIAAQMAEPPAAIREDVRGELVERLLVLAERPGRGA